LAIGSRCFMKAEVVQEHRWLWSLWAVMLLIGCGGGAVAASATDDGSGGSSQARGASGTEEVQQAEQTEAAATRSPLTRALLARLTVWTRADGHRVYARHCREATVDCESRIIALAALLDRAATGAGLDPFLLGALAVRESMLNPAAVGARGEAGILQLHPRGAGRDVPYVLDAALRDRCQAEVEACQAPVIERAVETLQGSIEHCGSVEAGLRRYASGRCDAAASYPGHVFDERDRLRELAEQ